MTIAKGRDFSKIKEVVATWSNIQQLLRSGDQGYLVPVVIPKDKRSFGWLTWFALALYSFIAALFLSSSFFVCLGFGVGGVFGAIGALTLWRSAIVEIEEGTSGNSGGPWQQCIHLME